MSDEFVTRPEALAGASIPANAAEFSSNIAWHDHKIAYACRYAAGQRVLDIGCVEHDPENYRSRYWLHRALREKAASLTGLDLSGEGVETLRARGFDMIHADAQNFDLGRTFDTIVAGDVIEHLEDHAGFLASVKRHLDPGGVLVISTPNPWYWRYIVKSALRGGIVANNPEHTCWFDPVTLQQLVERHDMRVSDVRFGSRYARDRIMPLPAGLRHTSWHCAIRIG